MPSPSLPVWLSPAVAGALSNTKGANTGADALTVQARYSTPAQTADPPAGVRFQFTRTPSNGLQSLNASDTYWLGPGSQNAPTTAVNKYGTAATWNNRVYIVGANSTSSALPVGYSAAIDGNNIGPWRLENMPTSGQVASESLDIGQRYAMCIANGYMFFSNNNDTNIWQAPIQGNGSLGAWSAVSGYTLSGTGATSDWALGAYQNAQTGTWYVTVLDLTNSYGMAGGPVAPDGSVTWATTATTIGVSTQKRGAAVLIAAAGYGSVASVYVVGGNNGSGTVSSNVRYCSLDAGLLTGSWASGGSTLPAARHFGSLTRINGYVYHLGGATGATGQLPSNTPSGSVYYQTETTGPGAAWTTSANSLATSLMMPMAVGQGVIPPGVPGADSAIASTGGKPTVYSIGGSANASTFGTTTQFSTANPSTGAPGTFAAGAVNNTLAASDLSTNGAVTANGTGTVDVTFSYGALLAYAPNATLSNGDLVQVGVTFVSQAGYVSPTAYASIAIGQAPTIGSVSPANASAPSTGIPAISFTYSAGAGGAAQLTYRIKVSHGGTTDLDTGTVYGNTNALTSAQVRALLTSAFLVTGTAYTLDLTITSTDTPMSGSTATATSSTTFTPSLAAAATTPTTVTATTSQTTTGVTVQWTNPGGSTAVTNRVYYRLSGVGSYVLLKDSITAVIGSAQSIVVYEPLVWGQAYDFVVSACTAVRESAQSSSASCAAIAPNYQWPNGFVAMLSIAGTGATQEGLFLVAPPKITRMMDSQAQLFFGDTSMRYRYGVQNMRRIELTISNTFANQAVLDTVIAAAFAGQTLVYRDVAGNLIYCGFSGDRPGIWDLYRDDTLSLTESVYTYTP